MPENDDTLIRVSLEPNVEYDNNILPTRPVKVTIELRDSNLDINAYFDNFSEARNWYESQLRAIREDALYASIDYVSYMSDNLQVLSMSSETFRPYEIVKIIIEPEACDDILYIAWMQANNIIPKVIEFDE